MRSGRNLQEEKNETALLDAHEKNQIKRKIKSDLKIYPNPSQNVIYVSGKKLCQNCQLVITDINGRILQKESLIKNEGKLTITFNLENGIYFINLIDELAMFAKLKKQFDKLAIPYDL